MDATFRYDVMELSTAIKPTCFSRMFEDLHDVVIYLDPDTFVLAPLEEVFEPTTQGRIDAVVTPHITAPVEDGDQPDEFDMLQVGVYNLGFLALRRCPQSSSFVEWWARKLRTGAVSDPDRGLFTDQKWCDLLPCFIDRTLILRHPGYNLAYWNLMHRPVTFEDEVAMAARTPLKLVHFSGFDPSNPTPFSKHQTRYTLSDVGSLAAIAVSYAKAVLAATPAVNLPYRYDRTPDGRFVTPALRRLYRSAAPEGWAGPLSPMEAALSYGRAPAIEADEGAAPVVTNAMIAAIRMDPALAGTWNLSSPQDRRAIIQWFHHEGASKAGLDDFRVKSIDNSPISIRANKLSARGLLRLILSNYAVMRPLYQLFPAKWRAKVRSALSRQAYASAPTRQHPSFDKRFSPGATLIGYPRAELGMGEHVRMSAAAMCEAGVPIALHDVGRVILARSEDRRFEHLISSSPRNRANIWHVNADQIPDIRTSSGDSLFNGRINIAYPAWELSNFPDPWVGVLDQFNEVWAPSRFIQDSLGRKLSRPVLHMPLAVELVAGSEHVTRTDLELPSDRFLYLFHFDFASFATRKNPEGALQAFFRAFPTPSVASGAPHLVIKALSADRYRDELERLGRQVGSRPDVTIVTRTMSSVETHGLVRSADALISLHRSEGFGRGPAEAMAAGKPVIATGYSGNLDFMTAANSLLVGFHLVPVPEAAYPYSDGQYWAEPDLDEAARWISCLHAEPETARALGAAAAQHMQIHHSAMAIGQRYRARLRELAAIT